MIERTEHPRQRPRPNSRRAGAPVLVAVLLAASCAPRLRPPVETGKRAPDLVEIRTSQAAGTIIRLHMRREGT